METVLQRVRKLSLLSQAELAEKAHIQLGTLQKLEIGASDIQKAGAKNVCKLAHTLNVPCSTLFEDQSDLSFELGIQTFIAQNIYRASSFEDLQDRLSLVMPKTKDQRLCRFLYDEYKRADGDLPLYLIGNFVTQGVTDENGCGYWGHTFDAEWCIYPEEEIEAYYEKRATFVSLLSYIVARPFYHDHHAYGTSIQDAVRQNATSAIGCTMKEKIFDSCKEIRSRWGITSDMADRKLWRFIESGRKTKMDCNAPFIIVDDVEVRLSRRASVFLKMGIPLEEIK